MTITTADGTSYPAHRAILSGITPFFESALSENSGFSECATKTINLTEHSPAAVKAFLQYCYTGDYEAGAGGALDFDVFQLADYVLAEDVKKWAVRSMQEKLDKVANMKGYQPVAGFLPELIRVVYENEGSVYNEEFQDIVVDGVSKGLQKQGKAFLEPLVGMMEQFGKFSTAILMKNSEEIPWDQLQQKGFKITGICDNCKKSKSNTALPNRRLTTVGSCCNSSMYINDWKISPR